MYYNSREERCKSPYGAVPCGTQVELALYPEEGEAIVGCVLVVHGEFADQWQDTELHVSYEEGRPVFRGSFTAPAEPELVWYRFRLYWADGGECIFGKTGYSDWNGSTPWQLTVYDDSVPTPEWFGRGVTYQIFPDRFRRAKKRYVSGMVGRRTLHAHWDEAMDYLPDSNGEITCSDFFGGDLQGITEKLDYLAAFGVTTIYLNPIFESASNHRYDTADYTRVDPLLGTEEDLRILCDTAKKHGIRVILDGVFNHIGSNSVYFNADGYYPTVGAAQSRESPYADWFHFTSFPTEYDAWWGFKTLPAVREDCPSYVDFIIENEDSVVRHWLRAGVSGWRLDVADELPDWFIERIRSAMQEEKADSFLIGEVWEDGSTKIAYSKRRRYLLGRETHALMNYPFRDAILTYLCHQNAAYFRDTMETLRENYPKPAYYSAMNFLATHDTPRPLTVLGYKGEWPQSREERAKTGLSLQERRVGIAMLKLAALVMFTFPGSPTIYYGDETGMHGFEDPFNRGSYPWGRENRDLLRYYMRLGSLRKSLEPLQIGSIEYLVADGPLLAFRRSLDDQSIVTVTNASDKETLLELPWSSHYAHDALTGQRFDAGDGKLRLHLTPREGLLLMESADF